MELHIAGIFQAVIRRFHLETASNREGICWHCHVFQKITFAKIQIEWN